jgi:hypothetical protein
MTKLLRSSQFRIATVIMPLAALSAFVLVGLGETSATAAAQKPTLKPTQVEAAPAPRLVRVVYPSPFAGR